jgi:hypothetical protein
MRYKLVLSRRSSSKRGFALLASGLCVVALFGAAGLAVDIGRIYITKNEAQSYADAAAVSAALKLDGTGAGLTAADAAVAASTNKWGFATTAFSGTVTEYSADGLTNWQSSAAATASTAQYARVTATVNNLPLYLLPVIGAATSTIAGFSTTVKASAVAGQVIEPPVLFPFSPIAHDVVVTGGVATHSDPDFGFTPGVQYDLKWPTNPVLNDPNKAPCAGDNNQGAINQAGTSNSGALGLVAFNGASFAVGQVQDDVRAMTFTLGQTVDPGSGDKNSIVDAFNARVLQDTDATSAVYVDNSGNKVYHGNGRRLVTVVVQSGYGYASDGTALPQTAQAIALGYAQFLLLPNPPGYTKSGGGNNAWCAIYIGNDPAYGTGGTGVATNGLGQAFVRITQ